MTFAQKLLHFLLSAKNEEAEAWLPGAKTFVVVDPDLFKESGDSNGGG